ncbi:MAG: ribosomal protein S18-alanine N-acetyltransferase [Bacilli bacterium]
MIIEVSKENDVPFSKHAQYLENDKIVGTLDYSLIYDRIEIDNIQVDEKYRDQKIGTKLMSYLISIAIENRVVNITLEVRKSNKIAIHLYKKFGFREVAIRKYYYGDEDAILMEKQVM